MAATTTEFAVTPPARPPSEWGVYGPSACKFTGKHTPVAPPMILYFRGSKRNGLFSLSPALREQAIRTPEKYLAVVDMVSDDPLDWVAVALDRTSAAISPRATLRRWIRSHSNPQTRRQLDESVSYWPNGPEPERWHLHTTDEQDREVLWEYCHALMFTTVAKRGVGFVPFPSIDPTDASTFTALADRTVDTEGLGEAWLAFYQSPACATIRSTWSHQLPRIVAGYRWRRCVMTAGDVSIDIYTQFIPPEPPTIVPELTADDFPPRKVKAAPRRRHVIPSLSVETVYTETVGRYISGLVINGVKSLELIEGHSAAKPVLLGMDCPALVLVGVKSKRSVSDEQREAAKVLFRMRLVAFIDKYFSKEVREGEGQEDKWESIKTWVFTAAIEVYLRNAKSSKWSTVIKKATYTMYPPVIFDNFSYSVRNTSNEILRCQFRLIDQYCDPDHMVTCDIDIDTIQDYCGRVGKLRKMRAPVYVEPVGPGIGLAGIRIAGGGRFAEHVRREPGELWTIKFAREAVFAENAFSKNRGEAIRGGERKRSR